MPIQHVQEPPSCPMHRIRQKAPRRIRRLWEPGGAACRQKMHMARFAMVRQTSSVQKVFSIPMTCVNISVGGLAF